jgi:hypothetical protein
LGGGKLIVSAKTLNAETHVKIEPGKKGSFADYIAAGWEMHLTIAIDYT